MRIPLAAASVLALLGAQAATAETTIIRRDAPDAVVVERPATDTRTETTHEHSDGCSTRTVSKTNEDGDRKTVTKETCD